MEEKGVPQIDLILALSESLDLISPTIVGHHMRVAFIALNIGLMLNMEREDIRDLIYGSLIHDVGALSLKERIDAIQFDLIDPHLHSLVGFSLVKMHKPFNTISNIVRCHHVNWNDIDRLESKNIHVPLTSQVLHLADRVDILMNWDKNLYKQTDYITKQIQAEKGKKFNPDVADAFIELFNSKLIWRDLNNNNILASFYDFLGQELLNIDELLNISKIFEKIIDFRSRFTATHSSGVAYVACKLAEFCGMTNNDIKMMHIAGSLHDLGKLAVPRKILEKPSSLSREEFEIVKKHVYYTYTILKKIRGIGEIYEWAGLHHERLNGTGYPFNKTGAELSLGSRIMAVADVFTAISEDRPYRQGMKKERALYVLGNMAKQNEIDGDIVSILKANYGEINEGRETIQREAVSEFKGFWHEVNSNYQAL